MRPSVAYLIAQSLLVAAWWLLLAVNPDVRAWFRPAESPDLMLLAFWLADLVCVVAGSAFAAWLVHRRHARRGAALWFTSGAIVYGTLYSMAVTAMSGGEAVWGVALMLLAAVITVAIARVESK
jgi:hypothetical protein